MAIANDRHAGKSGRTEHTNTDSTEAFIESLQQQPTGDGFRAKDYYLLALTGVVVPILLLMWGID